MSEEIAAQASTLKPEAVLGPGAGAKGLAGSLGSSRSARLLLHFSVIIAILTLGGGLLWLAIPITVTTNRVPPLLEILQHSLLNQSVEDARHAELFDHAVPLGDFDPFDRLRLIGPELEGLERKWEIWSEITNALFVVGIALLFSRVTRHTPLYPLTLFLVSLGAVQTLVVEAVLKAWPATDPVLNAPFVGMTPHRLCFIINGLYAVGFAIVTVALRPIWDPSDDSSMVDVPFGSNRVHSLSRAALRAEDDRRRRIKGYFSKRPVWPWFASALGIFLLMFAISGNPDSQDQMFVSWNQFVVPLFGFSALALLLGDQKRGPMYYFYLFVVLFVVGSYLLDSERSALIQQLQQPSTQAAADAALISYYKWYWLLMGALVTSYALAFRFLVYPRWHLATEVEVDACIATDFNDLLDRAFGRLGIDRTHLIAEPVILRGFADRSVLSDVFFGSWVDKNDRLRFTPQTATVVAFTADQVLHYEMTVDLTTGVIVNESNAEFFYQDVSNVARISTTQVIQFDALWSILGRLGSLFSRSDAAKRREINERSINDTVQFPGRDVFQINLDSGRAMVAVLRDNSFFDTKRKRIVSVLNAYGPASPSKTDERDPDLPIDENERAMRNIRSMLRDKKQAFLLTQS